MIVTFTAINAPSRRNGRSRIMAVDNTGKPVIRSHSGNTWVSGVYSAEVESGTRITVTTQRMIRVGKTKREKMYTFVHFVIAAENSSCTLADEYGTNALVKVFGARIAN